VLVQRKTQLELEKLASSLDLHLKRKPQIVFNTQDTLINYKLKPHQHEGVAWMLRCDAAGLNNILADETGLGKKLQCLTFLALLPQVHPRKNGRYRHVVICQEAESDKWIKQHAKFINDKWLRVCDMTNPATSKVRRTPSVKLC
jgi:SNF2 family DNA or RNA helicase